MSDDSRPLASPQQERLALDLFPVGAMSPGAYAARHGVAGEGCFGYERYRYRDARFERWLQAVARILADPALLARVRAHELARRGDA